MKLFAFIMSIVILLLSSSYCAENSYALRKEAKAEFLKHSSSEKSWSDQCSPFCNCASCPGFRIQNFVKLTPTFFPVNVKLISFYSSHKLPTVLLPIWQPPQLV
jgi:hypothetical protein